MRTYPIRQSLLIVFALLLTGGCALNRNAEPPSASEVFQGVAQAVFGLFGNDEIDDWRENNIKERDRRRKWQRENLSEAELRELGVDSRQGTR